MSVLLAAVRSDKDNMVLHKHHIVPRHAGGSDDPSNLVFVPVHEHANLHWLRFIETGDYQDRLAWSGLLALAPKAEIERELNSIQATESAARQKAADPEGYRLMKSKAGKASVGTPKGNAQRKMAIKAANSSESVAKRTATNMTNGTLSRIASIKHKYKCVCGFIGFARNSHWKTEGHLKIGKSHA